MAGCWSACLSFCGAHDAQPSLTRFQTEGGGLKLRYYIFDWDDNIVHMPTKIWMEDSQGKLVGLSTEEFARRRGEAGLRPPGGDFDVSFREFRDGTGDFAGDLQKVMQGNPESWQAPSFPKFKQALVEGRLFAIVTARGHGEAGMRKAIRSFVDEVLSPSERSEMLRSLQAFQSIAAKGPAADLVTEYLNLCRFIGVSHPDFIKKCGTAKTEEGKKYGIRDFVSTVVQLSQTEFKGQQISSISFGMSDDDTKNVAAIDEFFHDELSHAYPGIKFAVFDTGNKRVQRLQSHLVISS